MAKRMGAIAQCRTACGRVPATDPKAPNRLEIARFRADRHPRPHRAQATRIASARLLPRYPHRLHHAGGAERPAGAFSQLYGGTILELPHFGEDKTCFSEGTSGQRSHRWPPRPPEASVGSSDDPPRPSTRCKKNGSIRAVYKGNADVRQLFLIKYAELGTYSLRILGL